MALSEITFEEMVYAKYFEKKQQVMEQLRTKTKLLKRLLDSADLEDDNELESVISQIYSLNGSCVSNNGKIFEYAVLETIQDLYSEKLAILYQAHLNSTSKDSIDIVLTDFNNYYKDGKRQKKLVIKDKAKCFFISLKTSLAYKKIKEDTEISRGFPFYCMFSMGFAKKGNYTYTTTKEQFNSIISCKNKMILLPTDGLPKDTEKGENHISDWNTLPLLIEVFRMEVLKQDILADEDNQSDVLNHTKIEVQVEESDRNETESEADVETDYESENDTDCC